MFLTILILQEFATLCLIIDVIIRIYIMGIKSIKIAKYIIFINDVLLSVNLAINHIIYFSDMGIAVNNLNFLNISFGILYFIRLMCIIAVVKNRKKMQKNVRVNNYYLYIINISL